MDRIPRYAVITTRGERDKELREAVAAARAQDAWVVVVDNSDRGIYLNRGIYLDDLKRLDDLKVPLTAVLHHPEQPPNLSRLWNVGLERTENSARSVIWDVAVLNDDAILPPDWFDRLSTPMRLGGCYAAGFGPVHEPVFHRVPGLTALHERMPGWAFLLRGEGRLRADESLRWWCGDNDLDMQARRLGGTLIMPRDEVRHLYPDQSTATRPELQARTGVDMQLFVEKWGFRPWSI